LRRNFLSGAGINSSFAIFQDATGRAHERALALGIAIGSGYLFPTTFENEVYSDLVGERGVLMGALAGIMEAQYDTLRKHGHSPSEAFNETVEELTDWKPRFKKAVMPVFKELYERVASGAETRRVIRACGGPDYRELLGKELAVMHNSEMWRAGQATRALRPKESEKANIKTAKGTAGRQSN
jgi:ketol-acid reductoisomerase